MAGTVTQPTGQVGNEKSDDNDVDMAASHVSIEELKTNDKSIKIMESHKGDVSG
jgi:hypothetical protein